MIEKKRNHFLLVSGQYCFLSGACRSPQFIGVRSSSRSLFLTFSLDQGIKSSISDLFRLRMEKLRRGEMFADDVIS